MRNPFKYANRLRRHFQHLHHRPHINDERYKSIVIDEEIQWYLIIITITMSPLVLSLFVLYLENSLSPLLSYLGLK